MRITEFKQKELLLQKGVVALLKRKENKSTKKIIIGCYELEFPEQLCEKYEKLMLSNFQYAAFSFVESMTGCSDMKKNSITYSKEEIKNIILNGVKEEFSILGVSLDV